jgi:hypothetical protein
MENSHIFCSLDCAYTCWNILYFYMTGVWHNLFKQILSKNFFPRMLHLIELEGSVYVSSGQLTGRLAE